MFFVPVWPERNRLSDARLFGVRAAPEGFDGFAVLLRADGAADAVARGTCRTARGVGVESFPKKSHETVARSLAVAMLAAVLRRFYENFAAFQDATVGVGEDALA